MYSTHDQKKYSTSDPEYLSIFEELLKALGAVWAHIRYWAAAGSCDDEMFLDLETFKRRIQMLPSHTNVILMMAYPFFLEGVANEAFIEAALRCPYEGREILTMVGETDLSKNRAFFQPAWPPASLEELREILEDYKGRAMKIAVDPHTDASMEVLGYVPYPDGSIYTRGPY